MFYDLSVRHPALEEMDKPEIDPAALEQALRALVRINCIGNGAQLFWPGICAALKGSHSNRPLRVLDVGCGAGDMSWRLERLARKMGLQIHVDGCDMNPTAIALAQRVATERKCDSRFFVLDAVQEELPTGYDVIISSLFLHHLGTADAARILRRMANAAGNRIIVSDLIRSRFGLLLVYLATRTLTRSSVVHRDGVTSLRAAFSLPEIRELAASEGMADITLVRRWPERFVMTWCVGHVPE